MPTQTYPTDLTDSQWEHIRELLPPAKPGGRPRSLDMRAVVNAILYLTVGGIQWRLLPREYPRWQSVYYYFRRWQRDGTWRRLHHTLRAQARRRAGRHKHPTAGCLDSQSVKTSAVPGVRGYDAAKHVTGRKRHLLVDTLGLLLAVVVTAASTQDRDGACSLLEATAGRLQEGAARLGGRQLPRATARLGGGPLPLRVTARAAHRRTGIRGAAAPLGGRAHLRVAGLQPPAQP